MKHLTSNTRGVTLLELLVGVGLGALVVMAVAGYMIYSTRNNEQIRITGARDELVGYLAQVISQPRSLLNSRQNNTTTYPAGNQALMACLNDARGADAASVCTQTASDPLIDFVLLSATNDPTAATPLAGTTDRPVRYTADMRIGSGPSCGWVASGTNPTSDCPIEVIASFTAVCAGQFPPSSMATTTTTTVGPTPTPTPSVTPSATPTPTPSVTPSASPSASPSPSSSPTPTPSVSSSPEPTSTPTPTPSASASPSPSPSMTPLPSGIPICTPPLLGC